METTPDPLTLLDLMTAKQQHERAVLRLAERLYVAMVQAQYQRGQDDFDEELLAGDAHTLAEQFYN